MEEDDQTLAARRGGHERSAIAEARPDLVGESGVRLGQHLPQDRHLLGRSESVEWASFLEGRDVLRRLPRQSATQQAAASPQLARRQIVVPGGKPRTGESQK